MDEHLAYVAISSIPSQLFRRNPAQHPLLLPLRKAVTPSDGKLFLVEPCLRRSDVGDHQSTHLPRLREKDPPHCCAGTAGMKSVLPPGSTMLA